MIAVVMGWIMVISFGVFMFILLAGFAKGLYDLLFG